MTDDELVQRILLETTDPEVQILGGPIPALTSVLYRVCYADNQKMEEAERLIRLFIKTAIEEARK